VPDGAALAGADGTLALSPGASGGSAFMMLMAGMEAEDGKS
jgi:hypothetical protein